MDEQQIIDKVVKIVEKDCDLKQRACNGDINTKFETINTKFERVNNRIMLLILLVVISGAINGINLYLDQMRTPLQILNMADHE